MRDRAWRGGEGGGAGGAACVVGEGVQGGAAPRVRGRGCESTRVRGCEGARVRGCVVCLDVLQRDVLSVRATLRLVAGLLLGQLLEDLQGCARVYKGCKGCVRGVQGCARRCTEGARGARRCKAAQGGPRRCVGADLHHAADHRVDDGGRVVRADLVSKGGCPIPRDGR